MMWYWGSGGVHGWGWIVGFVAMIAFWAFIVFVFVSFFRSAGSREHFYAPPAHEDPEHALARRFANGDIDDEEFHRRLDVLRFHEIAKKD